MSVITEWEEQEPTWAEHLLAQSRQAVSKAYAIKHRTEEERYPRLTPPSCGLCPRRPVEFRRWGILEVSLPPECRELLENTRYEERDDWSYLDTPKSKRRKDHWWHVRFKSQSK